MHLTEIRIPLPMTVDEYFIGQLWSSAEASKRETGGGDGLEILTNEPFDRSNNAPDKPLLDGQARWQEGQFTHKRYHLHKKMAEFIRRLAPKDSLVIDEHSWNAFPFVKTHVVNPRYLQHRFFIDIQTMHLDDTGDTENALELSKEELHYREVMYIDIANDYVSEGDYIEEYDPKKVASTKTNRGPLTGKPWWEDYEGPIMCAYKLVRCRFKVFGLQSIVENLIMKTERRIFSAFHRMVYCWIDSWHGLTIEEIRRIEEETQKQLLEQIHSPVVIGTAIE